MTEMTVAPIGRVPAAAIGTGAGAIGVIGGGAIGAGAGAAGVGGVSAGGVDSVIPCPFPVPVAGSLGRRTPALYAWLRAGNNRFRDDPRSV